MRCILTGDGAVHDSPVLELNRDRLIVELHQESAKGVDQQKGSRLDATASEKSVASKAAGAPTACNRCIPIASGKSLRQPIVCAWETAAPSV